jgi:hypothetical protein
VSGPQIIRVSATDNVKIKLVWIKVDGVETPPLSAPPYTFNFDPGFTPGTHEIIAMARDTNGNESSHGIVVTRDTALTVLPPTSLPTSAALIAPPVGNQGNEGACVPFATVYAARSIEQYYRTGAVFYEQASNIFSVEYVFNQTVIGECASGTAVGLTFTLMIDKGVVPSQSMPYNDLNGCTLQPTAAQDAEAANYKIGGYSKIAHTDKAAIKSMILYKHAVVLSCVVDNSWVNAKTGFVWKTKTTGALPHTMAIVGYDDAKNAYKVMNSVGTGWGDAGFSWIDYDFMPQVCGHYLYVLNY